MSPVELDAKNGLVLSNYKDMQHVDAFADIPLAVKGLTVAYNQKLAVFSIDFTAPKEKMIAIVGPNGAGKSTFLKAALGIVPKLSGSVFTFGERLQSAHRDIAYVPQRNSVDWDFPARVVDVVMMGLYSKAGLFRFFNSKHKKTALECLERVGMADFANRQIGQLSGGQQQRVFLARSLAQNAKLYLLDEPFAGVDAATERTIVSVLKSLKNDNRTVICVHHDLATLTQYFDHVLFINVRKIADGPVKTTCDAENLNATYGGQLATTHIHELNIQAG